jgi:hypothetical protein
MRRHHSFPAGLAALLLVALLAVAAGCRHDDEEDAEAAEPPPPTQQFRSRPDLKPPPVEVTTAARDTAPGYVILAPKRGVAQAGPMIVDDAGQVVWFRPLDTKGVADFRVQRYGGRPVLTWWRGQAERGVGDGHYVIFDSSYHQVATVSAGHGLAGDIHEFLITDRDTALITIYRKLPYDLSPVKGPKEGSALEGVVQELDIASGRVLFEWHSIEHVDIDEAYVKPPPAAQGKAADPFDYFHINSVEVDDDGHYLISARNTRAIYKVSRDNGRVLWRLGGKKSDFRMGAGTRFAWQHDARRQPDGTLTLFDNSANPKVAELSRALVLRLDEVAGTATLVRSYAHPKRLLAGSQGNAQFLPNGNVLVGWGAKNHVTEFARDGRVLFDITFGREGADSYRAYREVWQGYPADDPAVAVSTAGDDRVTLHVSWNGATEVGRWQVVTGRGPQRLAAIGDFPKTGFETTIEVETAEPYLRVRALSRDGAVLGTSRVVELEGEDGEDD